eukprot:gene19927-28174_t
MAHVHVGSQGVPLDLMAAGIKSVFDFVSEVNGRQGGDGVSSSGQIEILDIGGGLGVNFGSEDVTPSFADMVQRLEVDVPNLFNKKARGIPTALSAKSGWFGCRIEYAKRAGGRKIVAQHAGVDLCVRTVYHAEQWPLRITSFDAAGEFIGGVHDGGSTPTPAEGEAGSAAAGMVAMEPTDVAGPCCIAGDIIAHQKMLPTSLGEGDVLMVHDVGGYYHSSYSKYNSRQSPPVYGYTTNNDTGEVDFTLFQKGETVASTLNHFEP